MSEDDIYLVWSNEHRAWWKPGNWGYGKDLREAGHYTRRQAIEICRTAIPTSAHIGIVSEIPVRLADVNAFLEGQIVPKAITEGP